MRKEAAAVTEKELKKLNRYQLLELLVMQTERADALSKQAEEDKLRIEELQKQLEERERSFSQLGSIAETALRISEVLEESRRSADMYIEGARRQAEEIIAAARAKAEQIPDGRTCDKTQTGKLNTDEQTQ